MTPPNLPRSNAIPQGRTPPVCPGVCSCTLMCGQAVIDGRLTLADALRGLGYPITAYRIERDTAAPSTFQVGGEGS